MGTVETWFPVSIFYKQNLITAEENSIIRNRCYEIYNSVSYFNNGWQGETYNTRATHNIKNDQAFHFLIKKITDNVDTFAKTLGSDHHYRCTNGWVNIAKKGNYQEYHAHDGSIFSAVYYVSVPEGSGNIVFEDPKQPDMLPMKNIVENNKLNFSYVSYPPEEGKLIIFRSYLRHLVEKGNNVEDRISLSFNFI